MNATEIETLAERIDGMTDVEAVRACGDGAVIAAVRRAEESSGSDETPANLYPRVLRDLASDRTDRGA